MEDKRQEAIGMEDQENIKVIDITKRIRSKEKVQSEEITRYEAIRKAVFCFLCQFRCSMCGIQINEPPNLPINLCGDCASEYQDYLQLKKGREISLRHYQNEKWFKVWERWEEFRRAVIEYSRSLQEG